MTTRVKPPFGCQLDRQHPLSRNLSRCYLFNEGTGNLVDLVTLRQTAQTNRPAWTGSMFGPSRTYVAASTNYDDAGHWGELDGIVRFTLAALFKRTAAANLIAIDQGVSTTSRITLGLSQDTQSYFDVQNGTNSPARTTIGAGVAWVMQHLVYDGSLTGDANRVKGYVDGIQRTLSFFGTAGAVPATAPSPATSMKFGRDLSDALYCDGSIGGVWCWPNRTLTPEEIIRHFTDPWQMVEREAQYVIYAPITPHPIIFSNASPPNDGETTERDDVVSIDAFPNVVIDPVVSMDLSIDGVDVAPTVTSLAGGGRHGEYAFRFVFGRRYTLDWTATTLGGFTEHYVYSFTVRDRAYNPNGEKTQLLIPTKYHRIERANIVAPGRVLRRTEKAQINIELGKAHRFELGQISVVEGLPPGYYRPEKAQLIVGRSIFEPSLVHMAYDVGDPYFTGLRLAETVEGLDPSGYDVAMEAISALQDTRLAEALDVATPEDTELHLVEEVGPAERTELHLAEETRGSAFDPGQGFGEVDSRSEFFEREES